MSWFTYNSQENGVVCLNEFPSVDDKKTIGSLPALYAFTCDVTEDLFPEPWWHMWTYQQDLMIKKESFYCFFTAIVREFAHNEDSFEALLLNVFIQIFQRLFQLFSHIIGFHGKVTIVTIYLYLSSERYFSVFQIHIKKDMAKSKMIKQMIYQQIISNSIYIKFIMSVGRNKDEDVIKMYTFSSESLWKTDDFALFYRGCATKLKFYILLQIWNKIWFHLYHSV